jgi:CBS domain-containing protein
VAHAVVDGRDVEQTRVRDVLQGELITVRPDVPVAEAAVTMVSAGVRHLPVADERGLLGMLDISTACRALLDTPSSR